MQSRGCDLKAVNGRSALAQLIENALWGCVRRQDQFYGIFCGLCANHPGYVWEFSINGYLQRFLAEPCLGFLQITVQDGAAMVDHEHAVAEFLDLVHLAHPERSALGRG